MAQELFTETITVNGKAYTKAELRRIGFWRRERMRWVPRLIGMIGFTISII